VIRPYRQECVGTNSYDIHLGPWIVVHRERVLDPGQIRIPTSEFRLPTRGFTLLPNELYLGVTEEYTETHGFTPFLEGKSSAGRMGIDIHATAGKGDEGFANYWTLNLSVKQPTRVYAGMPIGQLIFFEMSGKVSRSYPEQESARYRRVNSHPVAAAWPKGMRSASGP
jgi:dCTP deaminase